MPLSYIECARFYLNMYIKKTCIEPIIKTNKSTFDLLLDISTNLFILSGKHSNLIDQVHDKTKQTFCIHNNLDN